MNSTTSVIDRTLKAARKVQPDLWRRTEQIARIIDPGAFLDDWIVHPKDARRVLDSRLKLQQATALNKAQEILRYLGVNTDTDWYAILDILRADERDDAE